MKLFYNLGLIDVIKKEYIDNSYMIVEGENIVEIGSGDKLTEEQKHKGINLQGKTVMPGMFNIHAHALSTPIANPASLNWEEPAKFAIRGLIHLQQHLKSGVTFVRDMNGRKQVETGLRDAIREKIALGPDYYVAGQCLTMTGGHGSNTGRECDGPIDCKKAAREQLKRGADFIKIMATGGVMSPGMNEDETQLDEDEMAAAIAEAHKVGKKTAVHAHGASGIKNAVRAGIDSVEHGSYLDDECIELMLERNTALVPTLSVDYYLFKYGSERGVPSYAMEKAKRAHEAQIEGFLKAWDAGILIGVGTDAGTPFNPHYGTYMEFVSMVELGIRPIDALVAGTINSAKIVGVDEWCGSLTVGKKANFIVLEENPMDNIWALKNVDQVYKDGQLVLIPDIEYLPHLE
ncbi:Amidohydrolase [[Clostridium] ultunense Esp]|uniref:Amidohydrolase n=1 Tax=[Clostridium] ultunense Esp TaxID=1288971 RepID=M1ZLC4_9FIRM|nr:amidohydrolase family protein [Schnuerera ultunensis]CCQ96957.1 Amidohydrolase [[Clostridium] ultunense Esp]SHD76487.1 Amidohydrolase [[Clostridium] ultunense Esp]